MKAWLTILCGMWMLAVAAVAETEFEAANEAYDRKDYEVAREKYEELVKRGEWTANLFYNLGNTEARLENPGRAILNYERAVALSPTHDDALANLGFLREKSGAALPEPRWYDKIFGALNLNGWVLAGAVGGWLLALAALLPFVFKRQVGGGVWFLGVLGVLTAAAGATGAWRARAALDAAVVVLPEVEARVAPADRSAPVEKLPAGSRVRWLVQRSGWIECVLPSGTRAWVPEGSVERVRLP